MNQLQSIEDQLRSENESLRRQLEEQKHAHNAAQKPSPFTGVIVFLLLVTLAVAGYYWGYLVVEVGKLIDKSREQTDKVLNALFLSEQWTIAGSVITVVRSLSDLDPAGAMDYFDAVAVWVYTTYGVRLEAPDSAKRKEKQTPDV